MEQLPNEREEKYFNYLKSLEVIFQGMNTDCQRRLCGRSLACCIERMVLLFFYACRFLRFDFSVYFRVIPWLSGFHAFILA